MPRKTRPAPGETDLVNDLPAPSTSRIQPRATSPRSDSLSQSVPASRSRSPSSSFTRSLSSPFVPSSAEMDLGPQVASLSMGHRDGATGGHPSESISMDDHIGLGNTTSLPPPIRTRRKELFVEPMPDGPMLAGPTYMNGVEDLGSHSVYVSDMVRSERSGFKRKRESSPDSIQVLFDEDQRVNLGQDGTHLDQVTRTETLSTSSQARKGKGKEPDYKGKGKQRELAPQDTPIVILDSPDNFSVKPSAIIPSPHTKPISEPLSAYTCPICFSAPTNATLTPCGHICCGECLFTAVKTTIQRAQLAGASDAKEARCPVCRALIPDWDGKGGGVIGLKVRAIFTL